MDYEIDAIQKLHAERIARMLLSPAPQKMVPKIWYQQQLAISRGALGRALDIVSEQNPYDYLE